MSIGAQMASPPAPASSEEKRNGSAQEENKRNQKSTNIKEAPSPYQSKKVNEVKQKVEKQRPTDAMRPTDKEEKLAKPPAKGETAESYATRRVLAARKPIQRVSLKSNAKKLTVDKPLPAKSTAITAGHAVPTTIGNRNALASKKAHPSPTTIGSPNSSGSKKASPTTIGSPNSSGSRKASPTTIGSPNSSGFRKASPTNTCIPLSSGFKKTDKPKLVSFNSDIEFHDIPDMRPPLPQTWLELPCMFRISAVLLNLALISSVVSFFASEKMLPIFYALGAYFIVFCFFMILGEFGWDVLPDSFFDKVSHHFVSLRVPYKRGLHYILLGGLVVVYHRGWNPDDEGEFMFGVLFTIVGSCFLLLGTLYMLYDLQRRAIQNGTWRRNRAGNTSKHGSGSPKGVE